MSLKQNNALQDTTGQSGALSGGNSEAVSGVSSWRYPGHPGGRDDRLDFIRGFAAISFITAHFEVFTWLNFVFWERLGIVSGAGLFVLVSGLLVGITNRELVNRTGGVGTSARRLMRRSVKLYLAYVAVIAIVAVVAATHWLDVTAVTTFTDRWAHLTYPLYPPEGTPLGERVASVLLLRSTPHELQILGFYTVMMLVAPLVLKALRARLDLLVIVASVACWTVNRVYMLNLTSAQFEYAFPLLSWQLYFVNAMVAGYHARYELAVWFARVPLRRWLLLGPSIAVAVAGFLFAQTTDNPSFPPGMRLDLISAQEFRHVYDMAFDKNYLGLGRVLNSVAFLICFHTLLTHAWLPAKRLLGWLLLPLGRNSLYVFLVHVFFIAAADQIPGYFDGVPLFDLRTIWFNTAVLVAIVGAIWLMVRTRFLFQVIPR